MSRSAGDERLVVVGGGLAALRAVEAAREAGWRGAITLVGAESTPPYDRPQLSKAFLYDSEHPGQVEPYRSVEEFADLDVELCLGAPAVGLSPVSRLVGLDDGRSVAYDRLVVATGASALQLPGSEGTGGVVGLRTWEDARRLRDGLDEGGPVVVVGAGFIGSEIASAVRERGIPLTVVDSEPVPLARAVGDEVGAICAGLHRAAGVDLRLGTSVAGLERQDGRVTGVRCDDGTLLEASLVVVGVGARPATEWLRGSGMALHDDGGVLCEPDLSTSVPRVWAAGDLVHAPQRAFDGDLMRVEHWTNAAEQGALAGRNAVRAPEEADVVDSIPYFWSDWYGHRIQFVGSHRADEVVVIGEAGPGVMVLHRRGERLLGALTIDRGGDIMKLRRRIGDDWAEALAFARERHARRPHGRPA